MENKNIIHPSNIKQGKIFTISILNLLKKYTPNSKLKNYQEYISLLMTSNNQFQNMLVYHDLGTGKTITAINIINSPLLLQNYIVIILLPASLKDSNWVKQFDSWLSKKINKKNIFFISFNSSNFYQKLINIKNSIDSDLPILYIIDEAHNFFHNVFTNIEKMEGNKNALEVYNNINNDLIQNNLNKLIVLSATPILSHPFELALLYNLLRPDTFPKQKSEFESFFMNNNSFKNNKNIFIRRILGLTSFYLNNDKELFPEVKNNIVKVPMAKYQYDIYSYYEQKEKNNNSSYRIYSRTASNFVFPRIDSEIHGYSRPRPNMFPSKKTYESKINNFMKCLKSFIKKKIKSKEIQIDFDNCIKDYKSNLYFYIFSSKKASDSLKQLYNLSCKMTSILFQIYHKNQKSIVYSSFISLEGLEIMTLFLNILNISYLQFSGDIELTIRAKHIELFNHKNNILGQKYKVLLISSAGIEGISLTNVRNVHILEPAWNQGIIKQLIGRAVRLNSHQELPEKDRNVSVYHYITFVKKDRKLTDQIIYEDSIQNEKIKDQFLELIKISAFDCEFLKEQNMKHHKYNCFHYNQNTYIQHFNNNNVGPAYQKDIKLFKNNGLFAFNNIVKKIKIYYLKILVKNKIIYSYIDFDSGLVYDKVYSNIPIGILERDSKNLFKLIKKDDEYIFIMKYI